MNKTNAARKFCLTLMCGITLWSAQSICAQTAPITYQGKLSVSGAPPTGNYDFEFKLFDLLTGGTQQGATVTLTSVSVAAGLFTVQLDFGAAVFNGTDRFLEIGVRTGGGGSFTTLSPREQISSTPYAIRTLSATTADALSGACVACVQDSQINSVAGSKVNGTIPVASVPAGSGNYVQNTTTQQAGANFNISGNGLVGGNVGIGTTNPAARLHVRGPAPARILGDPTTLSGTESVDFMARSSIFSSDLGGMRIQRQNNGNIDTIFLAAFSGNSAAEGMRVTGYGDIGIGTNNPVSILHLRRDTNLALASPTLTVMNGAGGAGAQSRIELPTYDPLGNASSSRISTIDDGNFGNHLVFSNKTPGAINNSLAERMRITSGGRVGIGTSSPGAALSVVGEGVGTNAVEITNGAIRVTGAGVGTNTPAFIHVKTAANTCGGSLGGATAIDNPYTNGDPNAILIVTPRNVLNTVLHIVGVAYNPVFCTGPLVGRWSIEMAFSYPDGTEFNVLVIKP